MIYICEKIASVTAIATAACLLTLSTIAAGAATIGTRSCQLNLATAKMKVLAVNGSTAVVGTAGFQDLLDTAIPFTQGTAGCIVVQFSGDVQTAPGRAILVRAVLASPITVPTPPQATFVSRDETGIDEVSNAATFVFPSIAAGARTN